MELPERARVARVLSIAAFALALSGCEFHYSVDGGPGKTKNDVTPGAAPGATGDAYVARVMTYNIQFLNRQSAKQGDRIEKLRKIIADIDPTIVGVQEVEDRAAMELVFPPAEWLVIIDDDSPDRQDVAFAVRKPWKVNNLPADMDADDKHFLAESQALESFFPIRRDGLFVEVSAPDGTGEMTVVNLHAKARVGGRANTDARRVGASRELVRILKTDLKGENVVLLGDFNDSPDDASLNILETGDPNAIAEKSKGPGQLMINLAEELWDKNMVTQGANAKRLDKKTGLVNIVYPEARERNIRSSKRNVGTGPIMFDQILVTGNMADAVVPDSTAIYHKPITLEGQGGTRPSDHLPMYADIKMLELK